MKETKILILDVDYRTTGQSSIGSDSQIETLFGFKPMHIKTGDTFDKVMKKMGQWKEVETEMGFENKFQLNPPFNRADIIVLDTLSGLQTILKKQIRGNKPLFTQQDWGKLADKLQDELMKFCCMDKDIIMNIHSKPSKDDSMILEVPGLSGQTGETIGQYLDILLYSVIYTDPRTKTISYKWQVTPDEKRNARSLPAITDYAIKAGGLIEQDYSKLFELIKKDTEGKVKIGNIGKFGTGKTFSLRTLKNDNQERH